jgi:hypothetical protein
VIIDVQGGETAEIWSASGTGETEELIDYTPRVEKHYRFGMTVILEGKGARLSEIENKLWFMVSPHSLPVLRNKGANNMHVHHGDEYGLPTRPLLIEYKMEGEGDVPPGAYAVENLLFRPDTYSRILPNDPAEPWELITEIKAPDSGKLMWAGVYAVIEGRKPDEEYDGTPVSIEASDAPEGPWETIAESEIYKDPNGWHFGLFGRNTFKGDSDTGYIRLKTKKGLLGFRIGAHYIPEGASLESDLPLEVEHFWYEVDPKVGRRLRSHTETVTKPTHTYTVTCAEEPHDERIIMRIPSTRRKPASL